MHRFIIGDKVEVINKPKWFLFTGIIIEIHYFSGIVKVKSSQSNETKSVDILDLKLIKKAKSEGVGSLSPTNGGLDG